MEFILTDDSLDSYGERILASGIDLNRFLRNPIMLYQHDAYAWDFMPIGSWKNIRVEGNALKAEAVFSNTEKGQEIKQMVEEGTLNAVSVGVIVKEYSYDEEMIVVGQTGATITKSELLEASIVNIPANPNAVAIRNKYFVEEKEQNDSNLVLRTFELEKAKTSNKQNPKNKMDLEKLKTDLKELQDKNTALLKDLETEKSNVSKLSEQVEALKASEKDKQKMIENLQNSTNQNSNLLAEIETLKASNESLKKEKFDLQVEHKQEKALTGLVYNPNSEKNTKAMQEACILSFNKQYKVLENDEGVLQVIDKKTQDVLSDDLQTVLSKFAKENGYAYEKTQGVAIEKDEKKDLSNVTYKDKGTDKDNLYKAKYNEVRQNAMRKGFIIGSADYEQYMIDNDMLAPKK